MAAHGFDIEQLREDVAMGKRPLRITTQKKDDKLLCMF
jgi:hypothetical protein